MLTCAQRNVARLVERVLTHRFLGKAITPKRTNPRKWAIFWVSQTKEMGLRRCGAIRKAIANPSHKHFFPIRDITFFDGSVARWASALLAI
ncbi:hypothetical protein DIZ76_012083 [Coccidioides immitis]|nr:hypothetical protein DIZ76_012083 [Coccidioides immitis]